MESKRQLQLGELIRRHFSPVFLQEGNYIYGPAIVSVSLVKVTPDLSLAKVYLSIFNTEQKEEVLQKIINHTHILKQGLTARIKNHVRRIPQIHFFIDDTADEMYNVDRLFDKIKTMYPPSKNENPSSEEE
ncbi:MAG: ribosome-binding factor A [Saprospiraceae bacterium]